MHKSLAMYVVISGYTINYHTHFFQPPCKGIWGRIDKEKGGGGAIFKAIYKAVESRGLFDAFSSYYKSEGCRRPTVFVIIRTPRAILIRALEPKALGALLFFAEFLFLLGRSSRRLSAPYCFSPNSYSSSYSSYYSMTIFSETTNRRDMVLVPFDRVASKDVRNLKKFRNFALLRKRGSNYAKMHFLL